MPKLGPFKIPNYDIDRVTDLIAEVGSRVSVTEGAISEQTFQEEYLQKAGGTYNSYRYDMDLYGFINRTRGSDDVTITELFVNVADPLREEQRKEAISQAVENVPVFQEMYRGDFGRNPGEDDLRIWMVEEQKVSRDKLEDSKLDAIIKLYDHAYPYLEQAMNQTEDPSESDSQSPSSDEATDERPNRSGDLQSSMEGEYPVRIITKNNEISWDVTDEEDWDLIFDLVKSKWKRQQDAGS